MFEYKDAICKIHCKDTSLVSIGKIDTITFDFIKINKTKYTFPVYKEDSEVAIVLEQKGNHKIYKATVGKSSENNIILTDIKILTAQNRRGFFRINVSIDTDITYFNQNTELHCKSSCLVQNISCSGLLLKSDAHMFRDDEIQIDLSDNAGNISAFSAFIRRIENTDEEGIYRYGCEFSGLTAHQTDILYRQILKYEQEMITALLSLD